MKFFPQSNFEWLRFSVIVLATVALLIYASRFILTLQFKLLYHPWSSAPPAELLRANHVRLWQSSGADYRGLVTADETGRCKGTIVVFHGNGGTAVDRVFYVDALAALDYRVILAEYPMYGGRKGELGEKSFASDAKETIRLAFEEYGGPLFLLGESLGSGVAAASSAGETPVRIDGIVLITPWDSLASIAHSKFPFLPVRLLLRDNYDSVSNLASFKGKIAVVGAAQDEVIPIRHARKLFDSLPGASRNMWTIQGAGHNDWYIYTNRTWWKEITDFVSGNVSNDRRKQSWN